MKLGDPSVLIRQLEISNPPIGVYDAPDPMPFEPLIRPKAGQRHCLFGFFKPWLQGRTLQLTPENCGCRGCSRSMFNIQFSDREQFLAFLAEEEGLKHSRQLMGEWIDARKPYEPAHGQLFVGPVNPGAEAYLKTVTLFINPDQLSALIIGAHYHHRSDDPFAPVLAPFGSGCMQMLSLFDDLDAPQSIIGSTDLAMRQHLPADILAFTMTVSMFNRLCELNEQSFLFKPFLKRLKKCRQKKS